jgi:hypothetical protein
MNFAFIAFPLLNPVWKHLPSFPVLALINDKNYLKARATGLGKNYSEMYLPALLTVKTSFQLFF